MRWQTITGLIKNDLIGTFLPIGVPAIIQRWERRVAHPP